MPVFKLARRSRISLRSSGLQTSVPVVLQRAQDVWHLLHDKAPSLLDILVGEHGIAVEP